MNALMSLALRSNGGIVMRKSSLSPLPLKQVPEYRVWCAMKGRCLNPNDQNFHHYGGRGITVCDRWMKYESFIADMGNRPSPKHQLERLNNDHGYSPLNCKWATIEEQHRNQRSNVNITVNGETKVAADWASEIGVSQSVIHNRMASGMSGEEAVSRPCKSRGVIFEGVLVPLTALAERFGISGRTLFKRVKNGMDIESALTKPINKKMSTSKKRILP